MSQSSRSASSTGSGRDKAASSQYFAYRHPPAGACDLPKDFNPYSNEENNFFLDNRGNRKMGSVSVESGAVNFRIPCAFSYAYDVPVPPQPEIYQNQGLLRGNRCRRPSKLKHNTQKYPIRKTKTNCVQLSQNEYEYCPPFCTTVKSGQMYTSSRVPQPGSMSRTQNKTSVVWDMHCGERVPYQVVDFGQELYELAAQNLAKQMEAQKMLNDKSSEHAAITDDCFDLSRPGINSSRNTSKALEKATESLKKLPEEIDVLLRKDSRFESMISQVATKALNVGRSTKVYQDLIPVDPNPDVRTEAENLIQQDIKRSIEAARQPSRTKDPEPKIENFQSNSYTRIRPAPVPTPSKPHSGTSIQQSHDFHTIKEEEELEGDANRIY